MTNNMTLGVKRVIQHLRKQRVYHKDFAKAMKLIDNGEKSEALKTLQSLLSEHPTDPYLRNQIQLLAQELHVDVDLPKIPKND